MAYAQVNLDDEYWVCLNKLADKYKRKSRQEFVAAYLMDICHEHVEELNASIAEVNAAKAKNRPSLGIKTAFKEVTKEMESSDKYKYRFKRRDGKPDEFSYGEHAGAALEALNPGMSYEEYAGIYLFNEKV